MNERYIDHSYSGSEEEESVLSSKRQKRGDGHDESDELMLSEFLVSLQSSAGFHSSMGQMGYGSTAATAAAPRGPGHAKGRTAASRRTVVHRRKRRDDLAGPCNHCGALTSPQWRKGPKGKPVLCNACGIRFLRNRTLTKVMPKKRRHGAAGGKRSRTAAAALEIDDDGMLVLDDDLAATDEGLEERYSAATGQHYGMHAELQPHHLLLQCGEHTSAPGSAGELYYPEISAHAAAPASYQHEQLSALGALTADAAAVAGTVLKACAHQSSPSLFTGTLAEAPAGQHITAAQSAGAIVGRELRFTSHSSGSSRSLLDHLGDCPSLTLALAMHQQQQRKQQDKEDEYDAEEPGGKYSLPSVPDLQLCPPGSPAGDSSGTGFCYTGLTASPTRPGGLSGSAAAGVAAGSCSPLSSASSLQQLQQQYSGGSPPLSPLFLRAAAPAGSNAAAVPALQLQGVPAAATAVLATSNGTGAGGAGSLKANGMEASADILQLVQQLGHALGGVAPAIDFLKLCSGNPAAVAAAVAAVAASAAVNAAG